MDPKRTQYIRELAQNATPDPRAGTDGLEVFFRTDETHYKADARLVREGRGIILELLDEVAQVTAAYGLVYAALQEAPGSAHVVYSAMEAMVRRLRTENERLRAAVDGLQRPAVTVASSAGGVTGFMDG